MYDNITYCWDNFADYCEDFGISLENEDDWGPFWNIWTKAIDSYREYHGK